MNNDTRICSKCKIEYPLTREYFHIYKESFRGFCKACANKKAKEYRKQNNERIRERTRKYYNKNREHILERSRKWLTPEIKKRYYQNYVSSPRNRNRKNERQREYRARHYDKVIMREREYTRINKEKRRKSHSIWQKENRLYVRKKQSEYRAQPKYKIMRRLEAHRRRAKERLADGEKITPQQIENLIKQQKGKCWWCGNKVEKYHVDHRIALDRGGSNNLGNLVISCPRCNTSKQNKLPHEWSNRLL